MPPVLESSYLVPDWTFFAVAVLMLLVLGVLVIWPLIETLARRQWGYTLGVVLLGPVGGPIWFLVGRRRFA